MKNILEEAIQYSRNFKSECSGRFIAQNSLQKKVSEFRTDKTKLFFLTELRKVVNDEKETHEISCTIKNCPTSNNFETGLFVIDEELEVLSEYYKPEASERDSFSYENMADINRKLDEILDSFKKTEVGQEIVFESVDKVSEDLDTLKEYFMSMDKKSWFQLARVKLFEIGATYGIEEVVIKGLFEELTRQVSK